MALPNNVLAQTPESQSSITPAIAKDLLKEGNKRFVSGNQVNRDLASQVRSTSAGQYPFAVILSCIDSRVPAETVFDQGIGDIFSARVAGNFVNVDVLGSIEYSTKAAGSKLVVVMGHTACGAVKSACDDVRMGNITDMLSKITPAVKAVETPEGTERSSKNLEFVNAVSKENVKKNIKRILNESSILKEQYDNGEIDIVGAMYDVRSGEVEFYD